MAPQHIHSSEIEAQATPVPEILDRVAVEMLALSTVVSDVEALVGNLVVAGAFGSSASLFELQKLDRLRQSIEGIAQFLNGVGRSSASGWKVDIERACEGVTLSELADRLMGLHLEDASTQDDLHGEMEFFGAASLARVA